ncbi:MAG: hypothetical protein OK457_01095 [Thaumarchaeota archaeon]|nr:hypothetical protein [Nitrososphaerota archaeon]
MLEEAISNLQSGGSFLEIGFGRGGNISMANQKFDLVVGTDILPLKNLDVEKSIRSEIILADKAACFRDSVFDIVAFNPPYLPSHVIEDRATDGGHEGIEIPLEFLVSALKVLKNHGRILVLLSSLGNVERFKRFCAQRLLIVDKVAERRFFFETLFVYLISRKNDSSACA